MSLTKRAARWGDDPELRKALEKSKPSISKTQEAVKQTVRQKAKKVSEETVGKVVKFPAKKAIGAGAGLSAAGFLAGKYYLKRRRKRESMAKAAVKEVSK